MKEHVRAEEVQTEAQEITMEEEMAQDIRMDTYILEAYDPSDTQIKRTREKESGSRKKAKEHGKPLETSLIEDDVELIATIVEDPLSEVWENVDNCRASILE
jgi:hypothetical protein